MNIKLKVKGLIRLIGNKQTGLTLNADILKEAGLEKGSEVSITVTESNQIIIEKAK